MNKDIARARSSLYRNIRNFFLDKDYLEVETPTLSPDLIPESTIDCFESAFINEFMGSRQMYMIPSPEIFMKKMIAEGYGSLFQISKCFRNCEQLGNIHNPEFSMLEYYTVDFDEIDSIGLTQDMIRETALPCAGNSVLSDFEVISVNEACKRYADGTDLDLLQNPKDLVKRAKELGVMSALAESDCFSSSDCGNCIQTEGWDDTFNRIFLTLVEPNLPKDHPVVLTDYPQQIDCLAVRNGNYRRRWEMYINGIEVANCYLEETDIKTIQNYYRKENYRIAKERVRNGKPIPDTDESFAEIFENFPKCSGVAIGLDRLLMAELGINDIDDVLAFPFSKMI